MNSKQVLLSLTVILGLFGSAGIAQPGYQSPYSLVFETPLPELCAPDQVAPRNDWHLESKTPYEEWYSNRIRTKYGVWGPEPRTYPAPDGYDQKSAKWKRQRVLAVAHNMIGLPYQHHHVPDWEPSADWPWDPVAYGRNSKGLDCSNFTSWIYNYGLGIRMNSNVKKQAQLKEVTDPSGQSSIPIEVITDDDGYDGLVSKLKTGDLLYIKRKDGSDISHVIMWVGGHGRAPDGSPLIIDCTGSDHKDCNGQNIPIGVHLRPFTPTSWYYKSFSHAHRILGER